MSDLASELEMMASELDEAQRSAARMSNVLRDLFNDIGEVPEVRAAYESVAGDVDSRISGGL